MPTLKVDDPVGGAQEEGIEFLEAKHCLMIFGGSHAYESHGNAAITEQEVNVFHTLAALMWLRWS